MGGKNLILKMKIYGELKLFDFYFDVFIWKICQKSDLKKSQILLFGEFYWGNRWYFVEGNFVRESVEIFVKFENWLKEKKRWTDK